MSVIVSLVIAAVLATIPTLAMRFYTHGFFAEQSIAIGLILWFLFLVFVVTPIRMGVEKVQLTTKRLTAQGAELYDDGRGCQWLRLRVENPTALPIPNCYGKLLDRRLVRSQPIQVDGKLTEIEISPEVGRRSSENMELPPEGHRFPWEPTQLPETTATVSGFGGKEFLYVVAKRENIGSIGFPTDMGIEYHNWSLGDFELKLEIGSDSEPFRPTKLRVVFKATGGDIELVGWDVIN